jgi:DNA-binding NtrC family response regulator
MKTSRILVADDQSDVLEALRLLLKGEGYVLQTVTSPRHVLDALGTSEFDLVLMDLNYSRDTTSGREGLDLLSQIRALDDTLPVVVMTAWGSIEGAVEAIQKGARDYVEKPWDNARLLTTLDTQIRFTQALRRSRGLEAENRLLRREGAPVFIADSPAMQPVLRLMARVGPSDANVLITGEHGTGKEVVARCLHASSSRAERPFVTVNMGGLSEQVFESELFGHVRGAFTDAKQDRAGRFQVADRGTLFLDEIASISPAMQATLLRVLQTGEFEPVGSSRTRKADVRILSATNADIGREVSEGRFREDLLFRLNTVEIHIPPLRDRREDIGPHAARYLAKYGRRYGKSLTGFSAEAIEALMNHAWPGNVRELDHAVERAVLMAQGTTVESEDLGLGMSGRTTTGGGGGSDAVTIEEAERRLIQETLERHGRNVTEAAKVLGLSRSALYRRMDRYGL